MCVKFHLGRTSTTVCTLGTRIDGRSDGHRLIKSPSDSVRFISNILGVKKYGRKQTYYKIFIEIIKFKNSLPLCDVFQNER